MNKDLLLTWFLGFIFSCMLILLLSSCASYQVRTVNHATSKELWIAIHNAEQDKGFQ